MADETTVYLDHLIERESFRYTRSQEQLRYDKRSEQPYLRIDDLLVPQRVEKLRKPDFQRATRAWTPEDCVSLLDSLVNEQTIPSIIMWSSPDNGLDYILDGGHRVSAVLAWLRDDWGGNLTPDEYRDDEEKAAIEIAARKVRNLVDATVGNVGEYIEAEQLLSQIVRAGGKPLDEMTEKAFRRALFYGDLLKGNIWFHILWVRGDYEKAEQSFIKINKSGKQLTPWERRLIENRNSSFARAVMSVANISSARHYWPQQIPDSSTSDVASDVEQILAGVTSLHQELFKPPYKRQVRTLEQPLLISETYNRPYYIAEFLTVVAGGRGQEAETDKLISAGRDASPLAIVQEGLKLITDAEDALDHIVTASPKSLALPPAVYLYTSGGRYVRSLLYGLLYWLLAGDEAEVRQRKRVFCAYRASFERVFIGHKDEFVGNISRRSGSGAEITTQTARYFNGILDLVARHKGDTTSEAFGIDFGEFIDRLLKKRASRSQSNGVANSTVGKSRTFTPAQQSMVYLREMLRTPITCGLCGGILDITGPVQHDHVQPFGQGGKTIPDNDRLTHLFCNNYREEIEAVQGGLAASFLPIIAELGLDIEPEQLRLKLFDDESFG
jgi:hypothetical protein